MEIGPGEGVLKKKKFPNTRKPCHQWVCGEFWNHRGQHNWEEKKKKKSTDYTPNHNSQRRSSPDDRIRQQPVGDEQGDTGCMLRVRDLPERP